MARCSLWSISNILNILNPSIIKSTNMVNDDWPIWILTVLIIAIIAINIAHHQACHDNPHEPGRRRRACHRATGSWRCTGRTGSRWCSVQRSPSRALLRRGKVIEKLSEKIIGKIVEKNYREHSWGEERKLWPSLVAHKYDQKRLNCNFCTVLPFPYWPRTGRSKSVEMRDA